MNSKELASMGLPSSFGSGSKGRPKKRPRTTTPPAKQPSKASSISMLSSFIREKEQESQDFPPSEHESLVSMQPPPSKPPGPPRPSGPQAPGPRPGPQAPSPRPLQDDDDSDSDDSGPQAPGPRPPGPQAPGPRPPGPQAPGPRPPGPQAPGPRPPGPQAPGPRPPQDDDSDSDDSGSEEDSEDEEEEERTHALAESVPLSHHLILRGHERGVTSLTLDPKCSRLLSGSGDSSVRMWNFAGMDQSARSFRSIEPCPGHQIVSIQYTHTGSSFAVAGGDERVRLFDRDGKEIQIFAKGDMYISDLNHTKGHTAAVTKVLFDPSNHERMLTSSRDSSMRIWDIEDPEKQIHVLKIAQGRGRRIAFTTCAYGADAALVAGAGEDGSIQIWGGHRSQYLRPEFILTNAHENGSDTSSLCFTQDGHYMLSRGGDDTMKVWDLRLLSSSSAQRAKLPSLLTTINDLPNFHPTTDIIMSPKDDLVVTGTSVKRGEGSGQLCFYEKSTWTKIRQIGVSEGGSVVSILWNKFANQLAVGSSDSIIRMYYDPDKSTKGALLSAGRKVRQREANEYAIHRPIHTPHAILKDDSLKSHKRKREADRKDPTKSHLPDPPTQGPNARNHAGSSMTQHLMRGMAKNTMRNEDPREAILKYAEEAKKNPIFTGAYTETQPTTIFDTVSDEEEEEN